MGSEEKLPGIGSTVQRQSTILIINTKLVLQTFMPSAFSLRNSAILL